MAGEEYNKIHAMAQARKFVIDKFGNNLLNFWPIADDGELIRDLLRQLPLFGSGIALQQPGMLDYGIDLQQGYIATGLTDWGTYSTSSQSYATLDNSNPNVAAVVPAGAWTGFKAYFRADAYGGGVRILVAPANLSPSDVVSRALYTSSWQQVNNEWSLLTFNFTDTLIAAPGQYWVYMQSQYSSPQAAVVHDSSNKGCGRLKSYSTSWADESGYYAVYQMLGVSPSLTWPAYSAFTIGALVNPDNIIGDGYVAAFADGTEDKLRLAVVSRKAQGYVKNKAGSTYTLNATQRLHLGYNLLTLSYQNNVVVKLGVNGVVVTTATPSASDILDSSFAFCIGGKMLTNKTLSNQLKYALVDDVFLAKAVLSDTDLWNVYLAYITAAPLMQTKAV